MDINIKGNPGTGNSFVDIHIGHVETYAPNAATVVNNHYGDRRKAVSGNDGQIPDTEIMRRQTDILQYAGRLREKYVAPECRNRYDAAWERILQLPEVADRIFEPGKQRDTTFNRNLVANIMYMMCDSGVISETNATKLCVALEGDKDHPVRAQLRQAPADREMADKIKDILR